MLVKDTFGTMAGQITPQKYHKTTMNSNNNNYSAVEAKFAPPHINITIAGLVFDCLSCVRHSLGLGEMIIMLQIYGTLYILWQGGVAARM